MLILGRLSINDDIPLGRSRISDPLLRPSVGAVRGLRRTARGQHVVAHQYTDHVQNILGYLQYSQSGDTERVTPEASTHGTSEQRTAWFLHGYQKGDINECNTLDQSDLDNPRSSTFRV